MGLLRRLRGFDRDQSGVSFIEAAVIMPVVLLIIGGIYDFGRAFATMSTAQKSLRGATRYLTLLPEAFVCTSTAFGQAKNLVLYGTTANGTAGNELIKNWTAAQITPSCATKDGQRIVKISAEVPYSPLMWGVVGLPGTITMNVEHEERWIGQ